MRWWRRICGLESSIGILFQDLRDFFCRKKRSTETPSWKNRRMGEKFGRLCQIQSLFWFYVTMENWLQRFHFASKHSWLASAENFVNSSAIGKKLIEKTRKRNFSARWDINFGWRVMKLSKNIFPMKLLETNAIVVRNISKKLNIGQNPSFSALWDYPGGIIWSNGGCFWSHQELWNKVVFLFRTCRRLPSGWKRAICKGTAYRLHKISLSALWDFPGDGKRLSPNFT